MYKQEIQDKLYKTSNKVKDILADYNEIKTMIGDCEKLGINMNAIYDVLDEFRGVLPTLNKLSAEILKTWYATK